MAQEPVTEAYEGFRANDEGTNSQVCPALVRARPGLFGVCVMDATGGTYATMAESGAITRLADGLVAVVCDAGTYAFLANLFLITSGLGQVISITARRSPSSRSPAPPPTWKVCGRPC